MQDCYILLELHLMDICYDNYDLYELTYYTCMVLNFVIKWLYYFYVSDKLLPQLTFRCLRQHEKYIVASNPIRTTCFVVLGCSNKKLYIVAISCHHNFSACCDNCLA
jgi:hypothetical protein